MKNDGSGGTTYAYTYNDLKQLTKVEWPSGSPTSRKNYTYDANGNLATKTEQSYSGGQWNTAVSWTYGWDIQDRLISVTKDVAGTEAGDQKVEYTYCPSCGGAMRERIEYDNDTGGAIVSWLRYEYEGLNLLRIDQLYDGNSSGTIDSTDYTNKYWRPMNIYLHGPGAIGQIIKSKWYSYADQTATPCTTGEYYYFYDAVGNVVGVWDQRDGAYHSWAMDAFGNPLSGVEFLAMDQPGPKEHLTGKMFDTVTGLYYFHARWLDPDVGRFVSRDKLARYNESPYLFASAMPLNKVDSNGMQSQAPTQPTETTLADTFGLSNNASCCELLKNKGADIVKQINEELNRLLGDYARNWASYKDIVDCMTTKKVTVKCKTCGKATDCGDVGFSWWTGRAKGNINLCANNFQTASGMAHTLVHEKAHLCGWGKYGDWWTQHPNEAPWSDITIPRGGSCDIRQRISDYYAEQ